LGQLWHWCGKCGKWHAQKTIYHMEAEGDVVRIEIMAEEVEEEDHSKLRDGKSTAKKQQNKDRQTCKTRTTKRVFVDKKSTKHN
jgi:hypothetical protein